MCSIGIVTPARPVIVPSLGLERRWFANRGLSSIFDSDVLGGIEFSGNMSIISAFYILIALVSVGIAAPATRCVPEANATGEPAGKGPSVDVASPESENKLEYSGWLMGFFFGIIVIVAIATVVGAVFLRRNRKKRMQRSNVAKVPQPDENAKAVIEIGSPGGNSDSMSERRLTMSLQTQMSLSKEADGKKPETPVMVTSSKSQPKSIPKTTTPVSIKTSAKIDKALSVSLQTQPSATNEPNPSQGPPVSTTKSKKSHAKTAPKAVTPGAIAKSTKSERKLSTKGTLKNVS